MFAKFILFALFHYSSGVIYELSDEDYARMPPKFQMDDYEGCFEDKQGLYCMTKFAMVSDEPSPLLTMMKEYSEHYPSHYNHTLLRRGICITRTCKQYYDESEGDLGSALEACANETFYNEYKLKARVLPDFDCNKREMHPPIDYLDKIVAMVCVAILVVNIVASACDYFFEKEKYGKGLRFLYCFSVFRNWNRLVAPAADGKEPRLRRLSSLHGIRALTMFLVIGGHSIIRNVFFPENERFIENFFSSGPMHLLLSGTLIMQTFLLISSFLLVYNWLIYSEKQKPTWKMLPHIFMMRWLRLTPSFGLILVLTATWFGRLTSGPSWNEIVANEMYDCRRVWWKYLLYINNYDDNATCMVQAWYLAADTQLYLMAAVVFLLCRTARMRKMVLSLLFVIGMAIPTVITYLRNLDGVLLIYPEFAVNIFKGYPTFDEIYKRGHTNVPGCVIGMAAAYWVYDLQKTGTDPKSLRKYRWLFWGMFPLGALCCYSGTLYYSYSPPPSNTFNLLAAAFMKPTFAILIGFLIVGSILQLEDEDYARMPKMFRMDDYEECFEDPQGLYCTAKFAMVSDEPSALLTMMQEYSEHFSSHYNHTLLRRGICITRTCKQYYDESEGDLGSALEACANETFYKDYKLKTRVLLDFDCAKRERNYTIDYLDITVAVVCVAILVANIVASISDYYFGKERYSKGLRFLYCFSIFRNWNRLVAPAGTGKELRLRRLTSLHGVRTLTMVLVIGGHAVIKNIFLPENERFIENMFVTGPMHILLSGTLIMQTFLFISSFLLVYNWLIHSEKKKPTWKMLPNIFMMRWLRLTPSYGLVFGLTVTWFGKISSGPFWENLVGSQVHECRRVWWKHLLFINNYFDNAECMLQSWYLAADTQLYFMAAIVFVLCRTARMRKVVLSLLFVMGIAIPTVITYLQNLDGCLIVYPEFAITVFTGYRTFEEIYRKGHTNIPGYVIGMAIAYWVYDRQQTGRDLGNLRKYRWLYWALFPLGALCCYSGTIYYSYSPPPSTTVNLLYAAFMKPTFAILMGFLIVGTIFQYDDLYRSILECSIWTIPSRLSFSAYLLHIAILRNSLAVQTTTFTASPMTVLTTGLEVVGQSFTAALFYHILVEGPFTSVIREWFSKSEPIEETKDKETKKIEENGEIYESLKANGVAITTSNGTTRKRVLNKIGS